MRRRVRMTCAIAIVSVVPLAAAAEAMQFSGWAPAQKADEIAGNSSELNTPFLDGCPIQSPGRAQPVHGVEPSGRRGAAGHLGRTPGEHGRAVRRPREPGRVGQLGGRRLLPDARSRRRALLREPQVDRGELWAGRHLLHPAEPGPRLERARRTSAAPRTGPTARSTSRAPPTSMPAARRICTSRAAPPASPATSTSAAGPTTEATAPRPPSPSSTAPANDIQPNVRKDGREVVLSSNHGYPGAQGAQDLYVATRESIDDPWSQPANLGAAVNTAAAETRPSLSWDARTLYFGRAPGPEGQSDIYVTTRDKLTSPAG